MKNIISELKSPRELLIYREGSSVMMEFHVVSAQDIKRNWPVLFLPLGFLIISACMPIIYLLPVGRDPDSPVPYSGARPETWGGVWKKGSGYWLHISLVDSIYRMHRSGAENRALRAVSLSEDCRVLRYDESRKMVHTLVLLKDHMAVDQWYDLREGRIWKTDTLYNWETFSRNAAE